MKKFLLSIAALVSIIAATPGYAQFTGPSILDKVRDNLSQQKAFKVESTNKTVLLRDAATGAELFTVSEIDAQTVTLSGVVGKLDKMSSERRDAVMQRIAYFNFSSGVGTLGYNKSTGEVTMQHHLNPRYVSPANIAHVASSFGDVARTEARLFAH